MHFLSKPLVAAGGEPRSQDELSETREEARDRQAAALCLQAAATAEDGATRERLRRRAAQLLSRWGGQKK